jgi:hypothetical protein
MREYSSSLINGYLNFMILSKIRVKDGWYIQNDALIHHISRLYDHILSQRKVSVSGCWQWAR